MNLSDQWFLDLCNTTAKNSKCLSRKLGALIVIDKTIISHGYNGPPRGVPPCGERYLNDEMYRSALFKKTGLKHMSDIDIMYSGTLSNTCPRRILDFKSGEGLEFCVAGHAERNALINAARHGIETRGATLYLNTNIPCKDCLIEIINAGIVEIVCMENTYYDKISEYILSNSNIKIRNFDLS